MHIMANLKMTGLDEYIRQIEQINTNASKAYGKTVYEGAKIMADAVKAQIDSIPASAHLTEEQIQGLKDGLGISKLANDNDFINVKIGFAGYNSKKTEKYPNGQPNIMIARAVAAGTSFRRKFAFVTKAKQKAMAQVEAQMQKTLEAEIKK